MRYIGCITSRVQGVNKAVCVLELLARAAKHRLRALLNETPLRHTAATVAHFLNCLVGVRNIGGHSNAAGGLTGNATSGGAGGKKKSKGKKKPSVRCAEYMTHATCCEKTFLCQGWHHGCHNARSVGLACVKHAAFVRRRVRLAFG